MNDALPLVSVVVIFFNEEDFLGDAVESVRAQRYPRWELLLCDDGSTDGSTALARALAAGDPRIRYLDHPGHANRGMSATRNLGLRHAAGRYVALLDADDVWLPHKLEEQVAILEAHPEAAMVCGASEYWRSWAGAASEEAADVVVPAGAPPDTLAAPPALALALYPLGEGAAPCPSDLLLRRSAVEAVGGFEEHFRGDYQLYEDQGLLAKLYLRYPVYVSGACWDRYRQRPDSCVATVTRAGRYDAVRAYFLRWLRGYMEREGVRDPALRAALARALRPYRWPYRWLNPLARSAVGTARGVARRILPRALRRRLRARAAARLAPRALGG
jgi:glycosyltransferase involved in cell wall biosynthesis